MNDMNIAISQLSVAKPNNMTVSLLTKGEDNQSVALDRKKFFRKNINLHSNCMQNWTWLRMHKRTPNGVQKMF